MTQWSNPDHDVGSIKVLISEGAAITSEDSGEVSYVRLNNLVCFSYRYAPQGKLNLPHTELGQYVEY